MLLAAQLHQHEANRNLIEACMSMVVGRPFAMSEPFWIEEETETTLPTSSDSKSRVVSIRKQAVVTILGVLEQTASDPVLLHNTLIFLIQMFESSPRLAQLLMQCCPVETLCNVYCTLLESSHVSQNDHHLKVVSNDITYFLSTICLRLLILSGLAYYQQYEEAIFLIYLLERRITSNPATRHLAFNVRGTLNTIFQASLALLEELGMDAKPDCKKTSAGKRLTMTVLEALYPVLVPPSKEVPQPSELESEEKVMSEGSEPAMDALNSTELTANHQRSELPTKELSIDRPIHAKTKENQDTALIGHSFPEDATAIHAINYKRKFVRPDFPCVQNIEAIDRFKKVITFTTNHILNGVRQFEKKYYPILPPEHQGFHESIISLLLKGLETTFSPDAAQKYNLANLGAGGESRTNLWKSMLWISRDVIRFQVARILGALLNDSLPIKTRVFFTASVLESVSAPTLGRVLKSCLSVSQPLSNKVVHCLTFTLLMHGDTLPAPFKGYFEKLLTILHDVEATRITMEQVNDDAKCAEVEKLIKEDESVWGSMDHKEAKGFEGRLEKTRLCLTKRVEANSRILAERAMEITQDVNEKQCHQRKRFLEFLKMSSSNVIQIQRKWRTLITNLTHERSMWHEAWMQPRTWVLDPTEGPRRERRRFVRRRTRVDPKFYQDAEAARANKSTIPLAYLFDSAKDYDSSELTKFRLHVNKKIDFCIR